MYRHKSVEKCIVDDDLESLRAILSTETELGFFLGKINMYVAVKWFVLAMEMNREEICKYLIDTHSCLVDFNYSLYFAAIVGSNEIITYLLDKGNSYILKGMEGAAHAGRIDLLERFSLLGSSNWELLFNESLCTHRRESLVWILGKIDKETLFVQYDNVSDGTRTEKEVTDMLDFLIVDLKLPTVDTFFARQNSLVSAYFLKHNLVSQEEILSCFEELCSRNDVPLLELALSKIEDKKKACERFDLGSISDFHSEELKSFVMEFVEKHNKEYSHNILHRERPNPEFELFCI